MVTASKQLAIYPPRSEVMRWAAASSNLSTIKLATVKEEIKTTCKDLGITAFHLAHLLGIPEPVKIYRWMNGGSSPSGLIMGRLKQLREWQSQGYDISAYRWIDWDSGEMAERKPGNAYRNPVLISNRAVQQREGIYKQRMAEPPVRQEGQGENSPLLEQQRNRGPFQEKGKDDPGVGNDGGSTQVIKPLANFGGFRGRQLVADSAG